MVTAPPPVQMEEEPKEALVPGPLKPPGQLGKGEEILPPLLPPGHGGEDGEHVRAPVKGPQQLVARLLPRAKAEVCQLVQKGLAVPPPLLSGGLEGGVKVPLRQGADGRQPVPRHPHQGGAENRQQGDVLVGVVDDLQPGQGHGDLGGGKEVAPLLGGPGHPCLLQGLGVVAAHRPGGAQEDGHILRLEGPGAPLAVGDGEPLPEKPGNLPGHKPGLQLGAVLLVLGEGRVLCEVQHVVLRLVPLPFREGPSGVEGLLVGIVHLPQLAGHDVAEQVVGRLQHLGAGAEVFGQGDPPALPLPGLVVGGEGPVLLQKDGGVRQAEAVDGLLHIPHQEEVSLPLGQGLEDGVLDLIGVLVLVHHDLRVLRPPLAGQVGGLAHLVGEQTDGKVFQVGEVQQVPFLLLLGVGLGEILHQVNQAHHGGVDQGHVLQKGGTVAGKGVQHPLHRLFAALPDGFDLFLGADGLHPPRSLQPGKGNVRLGCLVPPLAGRLAEGFQALLGGLETLPIGFFQGRVLLGQGAGLGHLPGPVGGGVPGLLQQEGPPGGLAHVGDPG